MTVPDVRGAALVLAVFVAGGVVGALGYRQLAGHRLGRSNAWRDGREGHEWRGPEGREARGFDARDGQGMERMLLHALERHVGLDEPQRDRVVAILAEAHRERRTLLAPVEPALDAFRKRTEARVREVLRPDQHEAFDAFTARMQARHRAGFPAYPPPPPPEFAPEPPPAGD